MQLALPAGAYLPLAQVAQAVRAVDSVAGLAVPAGQGSRSAVPPVQ